MPDVSLLATIIRTLGIPVEELLEEESLREQEFVSSLSLKHDYREESAVNRIQNREAIQIDVNHTGMLSPYVFGHNLEHTRSCVHTGLSAQMLHNRKFAGKPSKNEGCPSSWYAVGGTEVFFDLYSIYQAECNDKIHVYTKHQVEYKMFRQNELQSLGVQNLTGKTFCGIGQSGMVLSAGAGYEIRTVTQCDSATELCVRLQDRNGEQIYAEKTLSLVPGDWQICECKLMAAQDVPEADITFTFKEKTRVTFGALSMLPEGHFYGMRKDVVEHLKEIGVSILRWPGGNFAGEYRWQDGLLPVDMRGPLQAYTEIETQPHSHGYDFHEIGIDEFVALCREIGAEPFITINAVWNSPEENAAWVEYCNGTEETKYGKLRAERGHKEPYHVKYWSLGNEMGYGHMEGPKTPEQYAALAKIQARAMLSVSPDLQLFSSGPYPDRKWAEGSAKPLSHMVPFISLHQYADVFRNYTSQAEIERTVKALLAKPKEAYSLIQEMRSMLDEGIHISFDEWNCWYAWYRSSCVTDGIFASKMLHMFLYESVRSDVPVCCYFQPVGEGAIEVTPTESRLTAIGQVFSLLKDHKGGKLCPIENVEEFGGAATIREGILTITLVNEDLYETKPVAINISGTVCSAEVLTSENLIPHTYFTKCGLETIIENGILQTVLPPHSVAKICVVLR